MPRGKNRRNGSRRRSAQLTISTLPRVPRRVQIRQAPLPPLDVVQFLRGHNPQAQRAQEVVERPMAELPAPLQGRDASTSIDGMEWLKTFWALRHHRLEVVTHISQVANERGVQPGHVAGAHETYVVRGGPQSRVQANPWMAFSHEIRDDAHTSIDEWPMIFCDNEQLVNDRPKRGDHRINQ